jgi:hypothetical protein
VSLAVCLRKAIYASNSPATKATLVREAKEPAVLWSGGKSLISLRGERNSEARRIELRRSRAEELTYKRRGDADPEPGDLDHPNDAGVRAVPAAGGARR